MAEPATIAAIRTWLINHPLIALLGLVVLGLAAWYAMVWTGGYTRFETVQ